MAPSRLSLLALMFGMLAGGAAAQVTPAQQNAIRQSCRSDYEAHCASVSPGGAAALQCLQSNMASLSPACQSAVGATQSGGATSPPAAAAPATPSYAPPPAMSPREEAGMMREACGGDFQRYCRGVRLGAGRALGCLADHQESLSPQCREAMMAAHRR
jgi:Cysteine rich repeat